jgi:hypothetical protein
VTEPCLHITFCASDAGALSEAFEAAGRNERVVCLHDNLGVGPIAPADGASRTAWLERVLGFKPFVRDPPLPPDERPYIPQAWLDVLPSRESEEEEEADETHPYYAYPWRRDADAEADFWRETLAPGGRRVLWLTRRCAQQVAGVMEWLRRAGDRPCDIIDYTYTLETPEPGARLIPPALNLYAMMPKEFRILELLPDAQPLDDARRHAWLQHWEVLRQENAPLRIIGLKGLQSAPLDQFDPLILTVCRPTYRKMARIVGECFLTYQDNFRLASMSDAVWGALVRDMVARGVLEAIGDVHSMRSCELRIAFPRFPDDGK